MKRHKISLAELSWVPTREEWDEKTARIVADTEKYAKRSRGGYKRVTDRRGLSEIPLTLKSWKELTNGYELEEGTKALWFNTYTKYDPDQRCRYSIPVMPEDKSFPDLDGLADSVIWTACTLLVFTKYRFTPSAIHDSIRKAVFTRIKVYSTTCYNRDCLFVPQQDAEARERAVTALTGYCEAVIDSLLTQGGELPRSVFGMVEDIVKRGYIRSTRWACAKKRQEIARYLIDNGICDLPTRMEQDEMIKDALTLMGRNLNTRAYRGVIKSLTSNKIILKTVGGAKAVRPYSKEELSAIKSRARKGRTKVDKFGAISDKIAKGVALTGAERAWKCRHASLFK